MGGMTLIHRRTPRSLDGQEDMRRHYIEEKDASSPSKMGSLVMYAPTGPIAVNSVRCRY